MKSQLTNYGKGKNITSVGNADTQLPAQKKPAKNKKVIRYVHIPDMETFLAENMIGFIPLS